MNYDVCVVEVAILIYCFRFQRVGVCLMVLHSLAEFVAHSYRLNTIMRGEREDYLDKCKYLF